MLVGPTNILHTAAESGRELMFEAVLAALSRPEKMNRSRYDVLRMYLVKLQKT